MPNTTIFSFLNNLNLDLRIYKILFEEKINKKNKKKEGLTRRKEKKC
jgi:hypothetical protein